MQVVRALRDATCGGPRIGRGRVAIAIAGGLFADRAIPTLQPRNRPAHFPLQVRCAVLDGRLETVPGVRQKFRLPPTATPTIRYVTGRPQMLNPSHSENAILSI
jgi:hypothetical protein